MIPACCCLAGASTALGYLAIAATPVHALKMMYGLYPVDAATVAWEGGKLGLICICLFVPFLGAGLAVATILLRHMDRVGQLYGADLLGGGVGCALAVPLIALLSPPGCVMLAGLVFVLAGLHDTLIYWALYPARCCSRAGARSSGWTSCPASVARRVHGSSSTTA